ncbi:MAG: hypothetical protein HC855_16465 [Rhizobiales bacterium]|nr:hypothetical protein [Hyphomicrobiales bacterium]
MRLGLLGTSAVLAAGLMIFAGEAQAAPCSLSYYNNVYAQSETLKRNSRACERELKRRAPNIAKMCTTCRSTFIGFSRLESRIRRNKSCFSSDKRSRRFFAELAQARQAVNFVRRGCGY